MSIVDALRGRYAPFVDEPQREQPQSLAEAVLREIAQAESRLYAGLDSQGPSAEFEFAWALKTIKRLCEGEAGK